MAVARHIGVEAAARIKKKKTCEGCREDFYNQPGNSTTGECWRLEAAKLESRKLVGLNDRPPWTHKPRQTFRCYRPPGFVNIDPGVTC